VIRAALDANVFVSALIRPAGPPGKILEEWARHGSFALIVSPEIIAELRRAAVYPKVKRYHSLSDTEVEAWISSIQLTAEQVEPTRSLFAVAADPEDDRYVDAAVAGAADLLVTGDADLLGLDVVEGIRVITPRAFLEAISR
jgi:putative PIN family toxin of toxin-antitoxin system